MRRRAAGCLVWVPLAAVIVVLAWTAHYVVRIVELRTRTPDLTSLMREHMAGARAQGRQLLIRQEPVDLGRISPHLQRAVIIGEDSRFKQHDGVDWRAYAQECRYRGARRHFSWLHPSDLWYAARAAVYCIKNHQRIRHGRSGIPEQLAKNLFLTSERSGTRKAQQIFLALLLDALLEKKRILELYLNCAEFGPGVYGAGAAARVYFDVSAADLTREQAAMLAATLPEPRTTNPHAPTNRLVRRTQRILGGMR